MWPGGTKLPLQFGQPVHARQAYGNDPVSDTIIYLQRLSYRMGPTEMIGMFGAVEAFERLKLLTPNAQPKDRLFPVNPRKAIHQLLDGAGVRIDKDGNRRTSKNFRHTYIMTCLQAGYDVYTVAQICRTSVKMIQQHYGSYLTARMRRHELIKLFSRIEQKGRAQ